MQAQLLKIRSGSEAEYRIQHKASDGKNQISPLRGRNKQARRDIPILRILQPDQCLGRGIHTLLQIIDRLIVHLESLLPDPPCQDGGKLPIHLKSLVFDRPLRTEVDLIPVHVLRENEAESRQILLLTQTFGGEIKAAQTCAKTHRVGVIHP